ncbi:hypothetical protein FKW77_003065 [Venturia effusa]|uniref:Uncharacterized protein n=1 Tax=Venturia effusa TaxID=50376 RepID=A0A517LF49_9PEZI|nr:hypothetical protein FKW77_003065 [Venturia effusa]
MSDQDKDKQARDNALMSAVAISVALDGPLNPAMADPGSGLSRFSRPVTVTTGLAEAGRSLADILISGVEPWALIFLPVSNDNGGGAEGMALTNTLPGAANRKAPSYADNATDSKKGPILETDSSTSPSQVSRPEDRSQTFTIPLNKEWKTEGGG